MVRYDGLLNAFHNLDFSRLTHPTGLTQLKWCIRWRGWGVWEVWGGWGEKDT
ncbi:MAG: hypothetical protein F6K24_14345 [Okeania sp. SIO2D1]|nr:hypothetical protein [Okeania sp. SIO2D1]